MKTIRLAYGGEAIDAPADRIWQTTFGGARSTRQNVESPEKATYYNQGIYSVRRREREEARHGMEKL